MYLHIPLEQFSRKITENPACFLFLRHSRNTLKLCYFDICICLQTEWLWRASGNKTRIPDSIMFGESTVKPKSEQLQSIFPLFSSLQAGYEDAVSSLRDPWSGSPGDWGLAAVGKVVEVVKETYGQMWGVVLHHGSLTPCWRSCDNAGRLTPYNIFLLSQSVPCSLYQRRRKYKDAGSAHK